MVLICRLFSVFFFFEALQLSYSTSKDQGRLEMFYSGSWTSFYPTRWTTNMTNIVCRELGKKAGEEFNVITNLPRRGSQAVELTNLTCNGTEQTLLNCDFTEKKLVTDPASFLWVKCKPFVNGMFTDMYVS